MLNQKKPLWDRENRIGMITETKPKSPLKGGVWRIKQLQQLGGGRRTMKVFRGPLKARKPGKATRRPVFPTGKRKEAKKTQKLCT